MSPRNSSYTTTILLILFLLLIISRGGVEGATITFVNLCAATVWPGALSNSGSPPLETTGFELPAGGSHSLHAPTGWSGRFWARTTCAFDASGRGSCATGDCGSGGVACNGAGAAPPATLAEFTLAGPSSDQDFYDVSLVDGYNVPVVVEAKGGGGACRAAGCAVDLNEKCPAELRVEEGKACRSACEAFDTAEYCCSGAHGNPGTCRPSRYSEAFKSACPQSYSYAYDDATSIFTCSGADYSITFCPASIPSQKSSRDSPPESQKGTGSDGVMLENDSWLANLATGDAVPTRRPVSLLHQASEILTTTACILLFI